MKFTKKAKLLFAIEIALFVTYNTVFFVTAGFADRTATFWLSYAFMIISFMSMFFSSVLLGERGMFLRDWLFGFPIVKHCTVYLILEFIVSTVFIILSRIIIWQIAFSVQFILFAVNLIFVISGFLSKETIDDVKIKVSDKTRFIKLLRADAEMLVKKCEDEALRDKLVAFAEAVRYSDPMSSEALFELEKDLTFTVTACGQALSSGNYDEAGALCKKASMILDERNFKCKALK